MLRFNNGKFKIMQIADTQDAQFTSKNLLNFIDAVLDKENPDLVVFTGDQIKAYGVMLKIGNKRRNMETSLQNILEPLKKRNIPFTYTFGNHDADKVFDKHEQSAFYESYNNCVNKDCFSRCKQYYSICIPVYDESGEQIKLAVSAVDDCGNNDGYNGVSAEQIAWSLETSNQLKESNNGIPVPTIVFQHIPVYDMYDILNEVPRRTKNSLEGNRTHRGKYYTITDEMKSRGEYMHENIACCGPNPQFDSWVKQGDIIAAFFGHDHINNFTGMLKNIELGYTPGAGFNVYGPGFDRAVRIFEFEENDFRYSTRLVTYREIFGKRIKEPVKFAFFKLAPSSTDEAKSRAKKIVPVAAAATVSSIVLRQLMKNKKY